MHLVDPVTHERGVLKDQFGISGFARSMRIFLVIVAAPPLLSRELCSLLTGTPSGGPIS